ncbi:hypothetical protein CANCADRAFT_58244 [Tortispora caseinolytica NRRL Y-17796]|uniref:TrmE-type G domain-containing protein n=1 Tax=Tortispora caseinolytica NRRL Y-17796 TaxID=767744 RepID=A0A1E4TBZ0_9ASCO|nr:hypothetical protein CANCADRAFT_58244 [Tortispora caseinolytica NRRL Y-17796]
MIFSRYTCTKRFTLTYSIRNFASKHSPTIYALSTAAGKSAIAVIRVSGSGSKFVLESLGATKWDARKAILHSFRAQDGSVIDRGLYTYFPGPRSYTGEDMVEIHVHGGTAVVRAMLASIQALSQNGEIRYAEAGEFTRRAFDNGKLDLTQVEGIGEIIDAETELQRKAAVGPSGGHMHQLYRQWQESLLKQMGMLTALIDFTDEDIDSSDKLFSGVYKSVHNIRDQVAGQIKGIDQFEMLRNGASVTLIGEPNAGKSTLLNALVGRDAAIVSEVAGTTRDVMELTVDLRGHKITLSDTAGIREDSLDKIENEGIRRAKDKISSTDLLLLVLPLTEPAVSRDVVKTISRYGAGTPLIIVGTKPDLVENPQHKFNLMLRDIDLNYDTALTVNGCKKDGVSNLFDLISVQVNNMFDFKGIEPIGASHRVKEILKQEVLPGLDRALTIYKDAGNPDRITFFTEELRYAADSFGKIMGKGLDVEEILDVVFSSFCIGK